jgi:hypothetical protein
MKTVQGPAANLCVFFPEIEAKIGEIDNEDICSFAFEE